MKIVDLLGNSANFGLFMRQTHTQVHKCPQKRYGQKMRTLSDHLRKQVTDILYPHLQSVMTLSEIYNSLVEPPQPEMGDLAFGCFPLAKALKLAPPKIAQELQQKISADAKDSGDNLFAKIDAAGPYLNFTFTAENIGKNFLNSILDQKYFDKKLTEETPKTMIEFSQPNTHKELHVGHMRNVSLGDALVRLHRYSGYDIVSATFPGDMGTHVAKCLWYLKYHNEEPAPLEHKGEWLGRMYSLANLKLEDEIGTDKEAENRAQLTEILQELESKKGSFYEMWQITRAWSIELMQSVYRWLGVEFDQWYYESEVDTPSVEFVKKLYEEGKIEKSEGALGMNLENEGLGFCLLLKSDGTGLYATKDLELARRKFQSNIEKSIYVVDTRQALHFKQVFKVLEKIGFPQAKDCFHLQYNFVELPDGAMSSRKGNIVPLTDLISQMENTVKTEYLARYANDWSKEEINLVASQVAQGAIKYGMLRMDTNKKIVFDMKEWLKLDGESGPFIQYSTARINSLIKKIGKVAEQDIHWELLTHKSERQLMQGLMHFHQQVLNATENYKPHSLCTYLYDLAKRFNSFYHDCPIATAESEDLKQARLALAQCTGLVLQKGLALLGIPSPERM